MEYGKKIAVVLWGVALLGCVQGAMAEAGIEVHPTAWAQLELEGPDKDMASKIAAQITANPGNATALVKALAAANPDHATAIVASAIATLNGGSSMSTIIAAAVTAAPSQAEAITATAVKAAPSQVTMIVSAAVAAAPSKAVAITVAALGAAQNQNKASAIINSALRAAPHDSQTVADLQSLATRNWTPHNNTQQNFNNPSRQKDDSSHSVPPVESVMGGGASPS